jgi:predicted MFS family arabinose efflux permease
MYSSKKVAAYIAWGCAASFYFYQYILRVLPGVMEPVLKAEFSTTAEQFGTLGAYYLYPYAFFQIPVGMLIDRVGVKNTILGSIILCIVGTSILSMTKSFELAQLSRVLMGMGSACAFMSCLKVASDNFAPGQRGILIGATLTLGTLGALTTGYPLTVLMNAAGWRDSLIVLVGLGVVIFLITLFVMRNPKDLIKIHQPIALKSTLSDIKEMFHNKGVMLYAFLAIALYTPLSVICDLWGVPFLMQKYDFERAYAADACMSMYAGLCIGSLVMSWAAEKYELLNRSILICSFVILALFFVFIFGPVLNGTLLIGILFVLGIGCGAEMLCFTGVSLCADPKKSGMTLGFANTMNMLGGAFLQQGIGIILDSLWTGDVDLLGNRSYTTQSYQASLSVLLVIIGISCCVAFLLPVGRKKRKI